MAYVTAPRGWRPERFRGKFSRTASLGLGIVLWAAGSPGCPITRTCSRPGRQRVAAARSLVRCSDRAAAPHAPAAKVQPVRLPVFVPGCFYTSQVVECWHMTLILTCITDQFVIQVSDRRLTYLNGPNVGKLMDDDRNKAVLWNSTVAVAYTGVTPIDGVETDNWLASTLVEAARSGVEPEVAPYLSYLRDRSTDAFRRLTQLHGRVFAHAFVGAGWGLFGDRRYPERGERLSPYYVLVSNACAPDGSWKSNPDTEFVWSGQGFAPKPGLLRVINTGQPLALQEHRVLTRRLREVMKHDAGPSSAARCLVKAVRGVAARNSAVGSNLMVTCIPREASAAMLSSTHLAASFGAPNRTSCTFQYVSNILTRGYGPHYVAGATLMSHFSIDAPAGINPNTGAIDIRGGSVMLRVAPPGVPHLGESAT